MNYLLLKPLGGKVGSNKRFTMKHHLNVVGVIFAFLLVASPAHASWLDAISNAFKSDPTEPLLEMRKNTFISNYQLDQLDLRQHFKGVDLSAEQLLVLNDEQRRVNKLYAGAVRDGGVDEWEDLLLQRAVQHAEKRISEEE